jgi:hypothetical protein
VNALNDGGKLNFNRIRSPNTEHVTAVSAAVDALHHVQTVLQSAVTDGAGLLCPRSIQS